MTSVVIISWLVVLALALIVLSFCAYELHWKLVRFGDDMDRVANLVAAVRQVQGEAETTMKRAVATQARSSLPKTSGKGRLGRASIAR